MAFQIIYLVDPLIALLFMIYGISAIRRKRIWLYSRGGYFRTYTGNAAMWVALLCFTISIMFIFMAIVWTPIFSSKL